MVASLGIGIVQQRFIPNLRAEGKNDEAEGLIGATTRLSLLAAIVGSLLLFAYLYWPGASATAGASLDIPRRSDRARVSLVHLLEDGRGLPVLSARRAAIR